VSGPGLPGERGYTFEFKVAFWLVVGFTLVSFLLWLALPDGHRAVPVLERTWTPLLSSFVALVFGKLT